MRRGVRKSCRGGWAGTVVLAAALAVSGVARGAADPQPELPATLDSAVARGLAFLAKQQEPGGSFDGGGPKVAMTGLAVLAFVSAGNAPDLGRYGLVVRNASDWLLSQQASDGYFGSGDRGMYTHAITTLALAEAYGLENNAERRAKIHAALRRAVEVILAAQRANKSSQVFAGGWRYDRNSPDSDLSLSGWNVLALRAAMDVGIDVPAEARQRAAEFVMRCYDAAGKGFAYQPGQGIQAGDTAIGMLCLYLLDAADANTAAVDAADAYLQAHPINDGFQFAYYATYYVTQASFHRGGTAWAKVGRSALDRLIKSQARDGGWPASAGGQEPGRVYATAMAVQALAVPYRLLPVYER